MICPDINLLLYAVNETIPHHRAAKAWWDSVLSGTEMVGLGHVVVLGFLRLSTHRKVFPNPLRMSQAIEIVDGWLGQPNVRLLAPAETHWQRLRTTLLAGSAGANLTTDAHIATLAAEYGMVIYSNDTDFARFPDVKVINPLPS